MNKKSGKTISKEMYSAWWIPSVLNSKQVRFVNKFCVILSFPALLFGQQTIIKEIDIKPYMYTQNYEHFKRLI